MILPLHSEHEPAVEELLLTDPIPNLFLLGRLDVGLDFGSWVGAFEGDRLTAVAMVLGKLTVPFGDHDGMCRIGRFIRGRLTPDLIVGPRDACDALLSTWTDRKPQVAYDQRLYVCERVTPGEHLSIDVATPYDLESLVALGTAMQTEDLGRPPANPEAFRGAVHDRITEGRALVARESGSIVFTVNVGTRHPFGCQVGGTFVPTRFRRRGRAARGMRGVAARLLQTFPCVTLHVNEANTAAVLTYERAGFVRSHPYRLAIMEIP